MEDRVCQKVSGGNDMESKVSIWMGLFEGEEELHKYTNIEYTENGDSIPSEFESEFSLGYYDRALVEKKFVKKTSDVETLLKNFSYNESFQKSNLIIAKEYNSVILIYDFEKAVDIKDKTIDFIGEITYQKIVEDRW